MKVILESPYLLNDEYQECMKGHPNFTDDFERLNLENDNILRIYNLLNSDFSQRTPGYFELVVNSFYNQLDIHQAQYLCMTLPILDSILKDYKIKQTEKEQYKIQIMNKAKKMSGLN